MTNEERQTPDKTDRYRRRFPTNLTRHMKVMVAKIFKKLKSDVATSGGNGL